MSARRAQSPTHAPPINVDVLSAVLANRPELCDMPHVGAVLHEGIRWAA